MKSSDYKQTSRYQPKSNENYTPSLRCISSFVIFVIFYLNLVKMCKIYICFQDIKIEGMVFNLKWYLSRPALFWRYFLQKFIRYSYQLFYFLLFYISFYISRCYFLQLFRTSFNIVWKILLKKETWQKWAKL